MSWRLDQIVRGHRKVSVRRQCALLGVNRSTVYYESYVDDREAGRGHAYVFFGNAVGVDVANPIARRHRTRRDGLHSSQTRIAYHVSRRPASRTLVMTVSLSEFRRGVVEYDAGTWRVDP
jgi:hypothetical protein